jgi:MoaA/NifB/PqqE/SkfB family radical SAM enzyme
MGIRSRLIKWLAPHYNRNPQLQEILKLADTGIDSARKLVAKAFPQIIRPELRSLFIVLTADCNLRCKGCRYGRDFMPGQRLSWPMVRDLLEDAKFLEFDKVRLYGGEPLLHGDLTRIVEYSTRLGLHTWLSTNGVLLVHRFDDLFTAGLRTVNVGFYGTGKDYDDYVQQAGSFEKVEAGIAHIRRRFGKEVSISLDWLLMRPTCNLKSLHETFRFAERYDTPLGVNLIHYSLPYFTEGKNRELQFTPTDGSEIERVVAELIRFKKSRPDLVPQPLAALRAIPDWLIKGPNMHVPCDSSRLIWVGPDGTVQMCYVTFKLGNLKEKPLRDLVFSLDHLQAARDAFFLKCPHCHCGFANRTLAYGPTRRLYGRAVRSELKVAAAGYPRHSS